MQNLDLEKKMLLRSLQKRARKTLSGKAKRVYIDAKGNNLASVTDLAVANILQFAGVKYAYRASVNVGRKQLIPTFTTRNGFIIVDNDGEGGEVVYELKKAFPNKQVLFIARAAKGSALSEIGSPIASFFIDEDTDAERLESIFVDDPSFAFDYSHILPWTKKCSVLHGHTSAVMVELIGQPRKGMIVDFGDVKDIVKGALKEMDHKLFISRKYLVKEDSKTYRIRFEGSNGGFDLKVPKTSTFFLEGEATIENLADATLRLLVPRMPKYVQGIGVYVYEGLNKGSHIMASLTRELH